MYYCRSLPSYSGQCCWHSEGHLLLHTPLLNKTLRLSSARMFVSIYVSVTKPTCPALSAWLNTGAIRSMKVTGKAIMLCGYGININVMCSTTWPVGSMCDCKRCRNFGLVSFGGNSIRSWQWPWYRSQKERQCQLRVNIMSNRKKVMLTKDAPLNSHLAVYIL